MIPSERALCSKTPASRPIATGCAISASSTNALPRARGWARSFKRCCGGSGIEVRIRSNEWATFYDDMQRGNFDIAAMPWIGIRDPHHYYMIFDSRMTPPRGLNRGDYSNPEMDRLLEAGDSTIDDAARKNIYARVQQLAAGRSPLRVALVAGQRGGDESRGFGLRAISERQPAIARDAQAHAVIELGSGRGGFAGVIAYLGRRLARADSGRAWRRDDHLRADSSGARRSDRRDAR